MQYGSKNTAAKRSKYILRYYFSLTLRTQFLPKGQRWAFKWAIPMASGSQKKTVKPTFKSCCSIITQTYFIFEKKTDTLNVVFMHNVSGKVQLSFSFMCNLPFLLKLFLIQNYFFSFLFFCFTSRTLSQRGRSPHMLPGKRYIMFHTGEG